VDMWHKLAGRWFPSELALSTELLSKAFYSLDCQWTVVFTAVQCR